MKTLELKLKKDVLIVQSEETGNINYWVTIHSDKWEFICLGSELTEEIASELVDKSSFVVDRWYHLAKRGFKANVESKGFYWLENPIREEPRSYSEVIDGISPDELMDDLKEWQEAEEKTFKNPLIFVKK